eukprot:gnl/MRDRNA2_/MRDRNA2_93448_c0_seq1.p1 gnl/MRDRNA2_/MRDRNA2_93448_c0~~gnl/MRDRNA2_/MRDRNA2_93448_c0_seq1.p1  ORF type:complete len:585 (+),score=106.85 gnl/MRDRNA2_/MRDRNA2_93448_c0_seq1:114-1868(+)
MEIGEGSSGLRDIKLARAGGGGTVAWLCTESDSENEKANATASGSPSPPQPLPPNVKQPEGPPKHPRTPKDASTNPAPALRQRRLRAAPPAGAERTKNRRRSTLFTGTSRYSGVVKDRKKVELHEARVKAGHQLRQRFACERLDPDDLNMTSQGFFGHAFLDQDSRFPEWLQRRADFRSVCPRFCDSSDGFLAAMQSMPQELLLRKAFSNTPMLTTLNPVMMGKLARRCTIQEYCADDVVFREGEVADKMFVIIQGQVGVWVAREQKDGQEEEKEDVPINILGEGIVFGELGYEITGKRNATVICQTPCSLAIIDSQLYREVIYGERQRQIRWLVDWLTEKVPLAEGLSVRKVLALAHLLLVHPLKLGETVYREGDRAEMLYVVRKGVCVARKRFSFSTEHRWPTGHDAWRNDERTLVKEAYLRSYSEGDVFGEEALANESKRQWTVTADTASSAEKASQINDDKTPFASMEDVELFEISAAAIQHLVLPSKLRAMHAERFQKESEDLIEKRKHEVFYQMCAGRHRAETVLMESPRRYLERNGWERESSMHQRVRLPALKSTSLGNPAAGYVGLPGVGGCPVAD